MDTNLLRTVAHLSNEALLAQVTHLAAREREATVALIAHLAELDSRRLYLAEGYSSLFSYCTQHLHLSEHAAYGRIEAARAARRFPVILERLEEGSITLTTVCLLASHLTEENYQAAMDAARHLSRRQVEELVAYLHPQPQVPACVRRLPAPRSFKSSPSSSSPSHGDLCTDGIGAESAGAANSPEPCADAQVASPLLSAATASSATAALAPARPAVVVPLAPQRYKVQFTVSAETYQKLRLAQALLRQQIPDGDPAAIFDRALTVLLDVLAKQKLAATDRPRDRATEQPRSAGVSRSRHIPAKVKRRVWLRDGGQCAFVSPAGRRCSEQGFLEFHHVVPYSAGGAASVDNVQLRCRAHNGYEAELAFGPDRRSEARENQMAYVGSRDETVCTAATTGSTATRSGPGNSSGTQVTHRSRGTSPWPSISPFDSRSGSTADAPVLSTDLIEDHAHVVRRNQGHRVSPPP